MLGIAGGQSEPGPHRPPGSGRQGPDAPVAPHPPQPGPVIVVVVVDEHRHRRMGGDVGQALQRRRPLRLGVDRAVHRVAGEDEDEGNDVRTAVAPHRRQPGDPSGAEASAGLLAVHTRLV